MSDSSDVTLKLSEASRHCGVSASILRRLAEDRLLPGTVRSGSGHVYLRTDSVPTFDTIEALVLEQVRVHTTAAQQALARVKVELEAVENDLAEIADDPWAQIGDDLHAFRHHTTRDHTTLSSALDRLQSAVWELRSYKEDLQEIRPRGS